MGELIIVIVQLKDGLGSSTLCFEVATRFSCYSCHDRIHRGSKYIPRSSRPTAIGIANHKLLILNALNGTVESLSKRLFHLFKFWTQSLQLRHNSLSVEHRKNLPHR